MGAPHLQRTETYSMKDRGNWVQNYTGGKVYPLAPRPEGIKIQDIAAALSKVCRYSGHC